MLHKSGGTRKLLAKVIPPLANFSVMRMKNLARGRGELLEVGYGLWRLSRGNVDGCLCCSTWHGGGGPFQMPSPTLATN